MLKIIFLVCLPLSVFCQNTIGFPEVANFSKQQYKGGLQNWDIKQDRNGVIYAANNEGLLTYDGVYWKKFPLPNKTIVRSVEIGNDNRIYTGGQDELGFFDITSNGSLNYHSLTELLPQKDRVFGDVWDIVSYGGGIFFRTYTHIFYYHKGKIEVYRPPSTGWLFLGIANNQVYAQEDKNGLLKYQNGNWIIATGESDLPQDAVITSVNESQGNSAVFTTLKNGIFSFNNGLLTKIPSANNLLFENNRIYAAVKINQNWLALATTFNGVFIIDMTGAVIQHFSKTEKLQNNNVLCIFFDQQQNIWLGLDNGIDFIAYNNAVKLISPKFNNEPGYAALVHKNMLYTGTSNGLFSVALQPVTDLSFCKGDFSFVNNTAGQIWGLAEINGKLLTGHHEGTFVVNNNTAVPVFLNSSGTWKFLPLSPVFPAAKAVAGTYNGLTILNNSSNSFTVEGSVPGFKESSRYLVLDKYNDIWVSHPYHGVFKLTPENGDRYNITNYDSKSGLPSTLDNHVFKIKNEIVVASQKGVYRYNEKDAFEASPFFTNLLGTQSIRYLSEDTQGNIWFVHEKSLGVIDISTSDTSIYYIPELNNKLLSGFEFVYSLNKNNIFIGGEKGIFHINYEKYKQNIQELLVQIRTVKILNKKDSLLFGGYFSDINTTQVQSEKKIYSLPYNYGTIRFEYSSAQFANQKSLEYSYRLIGLDKNWSEWSEKTEKEYTTLTPGAYTFEIKVRNNLGSESKVSAYTFRILPPWYKTKLAVTFYLLLLSGLLYVGYRWQKNKFKKQKQKFEEEQKKLQYIHELEINKTESELIALQNEKLATEITYKNSELASSAMHLAKKGELLTKVKGELSHVMKKLDNDHAINELKRMIKSLNEDENIDQEWENFSKHFDKVNGDFILKLKEKHPTLTSNEVKLCTYLRMNLSTKEIAQLMNISVRGVEISRYRLRKKLAITTDTNLFDYFIKEFKEYEK